jgi:hypothetical protein
VETGRQVENGWRFVADVLSKDGHHDLANDVRRFVERMPPAKTAREQIAHELRNAFAILAFETFSELAELGPIASSQSPAQLRATDSREICCTSRHELDTIWCRSHNCA